MKAKVPPKLPNLDMKAFSRDLRIFMDLESGKRKSLPRGWKIENAFTIPSPAWIRAARRRFKLTPQEFGAVVGLQAEGVKAWESGKKVPDGTAARLMGLLVRKPHLVKFMRQPWKDDEITKKLGRKAYRKAS